MNSLGAKVLAVGEVLAVHATFYGVAWLLAPVTELQMRSLGFPLAAKLVYLLLPVLWLLATRRRLGEFGLHLKTWRADLKAAMSAFFPVAMVAATIGLMPHLRWHGALLQTVLHIGLLFLVARALTRRPDPASGVITIVLACLVLGGYTWWKGIFPGLQPGLVNLVNSLIFVGLAEEIWYRGFIQTRLNQVFRRRWTFYGVRWGWGVLLAAAIFGAVHVLNGWDMHTGEFTPLWWWGVWTAAGALVYAYVREKTGSVLAGAVLHGLPHAIASFFMAA